MKNEQSKRGLRTDRGGRGRGMRRRPMRRRPMLFSPTVRSALRYIAKGARI